MSMMFVGPKATEFYQLLCLQEVLAREMKGIQTFPGKDRVFKKLKKAHGWTGSKKKIYILLSKMIDEKGKDIIVRTGKDGFEECIHKEDLCGR